MRLRWLFRRRSVVQRINNWTNVYKLETRDATATQSRCERRAA